MVHLYADGNDIVRGKIGDVGEEKTWGNTEKMGTNNKVEETAVDRMREDGSTMVIGIKAKTSSIRFTSRTCQILF